MRQPRPEARSTREDTPVRSKRVPLGTSRTKLSAPQRAGYVRRWVNDAEGRLQQAQDGDYQFVTDPSIQIGDADIDNVNRDLGARVSRVVDKSTGQKAYLMEIKQEYYDEDQSEKAAKLRATEDQIRKGKIDDSEGRYVPKGGISIETK